MIRTYLIPLLAIVGVIFAMVTVVKGSKPPPAQPPVIAPPSAPFPAFVAGSGLIECSSENIAIGSPVNELVTLVAAKVGASVKAGDVLFELDTRQLGAELAQRQAAVQVAQRQLEKLRAGTRPELLPAARARLAETQAVLEDNRSQLERWERVGDTRAVSDEDLSRRRFAVQTAAARVAEAEAEVKLLEAGTWAPDVRVAEAAQQQAEAALAATRIEIERRSVRSPLDGKILKVNLRPGEFAQAGMLSNPLILMGAVSPLHVRVDVDEHEAWRVRQGAKAHAFARGNRDISTPLEFVRFEPYVIPKKSLTGDSSERVDTRVLQVLYRFDPGSLPLYVGQQVDVFIEAAPIDRGATATPVAEPPPTTK